MEVVSTHWIYMPPFPDKTRILCWMAPILMSISSWSGSSPPVKIKMEINLFRSWSMDLIFNYLKHQTTFSCTSFAGLVCVKLHQVLECTWNILMHYTPTRYTVFLFFLAEALSDFNIKLSFDHQYILKFFHTWLFFSLKTATVTDNLSQLMI